jgi:hypothetical protein
MKFKYRKAINHKYFTQYFHIFCLSRDQRLKHNMDKSFKTKECS